MKTTPILSVALFALSCLPEILAQSPPAGYPEAITLQISEGPNWSGGELLMNWNGAIYQDGFGRGLVEYNPNENEWVMMFDDLSGVTGFGAAPWDGTQLQIANNYNGILAGSGYQVIIPEPAALPFVVALLAGLLKRPRARAQSSH